MRMALGPPHFVEHEIARDLEQPGCEFCASHVTPGAYPDPNENLLSNVLDIRITAEHSGHCASDEGLMPFDQRLESRGIPLRHQAHQADVFRVISGARR